MDNCPICNSELRESHPEGALSNIHIKNCHVCGKYKITLELSIDLKDPYYNDKKYILSGITRQAHEEGNCVSIGKDNIESLINSAQIPEYPMGKMDLILFYIQRKSPYDGKPVLINADLTYPIAFAKNSEEMIFYIDTLKNELEFINGAGKAGWKLTVKGWQRIAEISKEKRDSNQAFVAMWFDQEMDDAYENGFHKALDESGYKVIRMDRVPHNKKIDDEIIAKIRRSGLLIADLTGMRTGVFFEAGFALGLGIEVIWTCQKDDFSKVHEHFDTRQYNYIEWENPEDLKTKLKYRIEATIPKGK